MFDSAAFFAILRVFLCAVNAVGVIVSLNASITHVSHLRSCDPVGSSARASTKLLLFGSTLEFLACCIRMIHCGFGPFCSSYRLYYATHFIFLYFALAFEIVATLVSIMLFLRWGAFGSVKFLKRHLGVTLAVIGTTLFTLIVLLGILQVNVHCPLKILRFRPNNWS